MSVAELPWSDCKVAFDCASFDLFDTLDEKLLPKGWILDEIDGSGSRCVAVFRVEGALRIADGQKVLSLIAKAEA